MLSHTETEETVRLEMNMLPETQIIQVLLKTRYLLHC